MKTREAPAVRAAQERAVLLLELDQLPGVAEYRQDLVVVKVDRRHFVTDLTRTRLDHRWPPRI